MWLMFAFASAFFAGITAILAKIGVKNVDSNVATAIRTIIILIFSWMMVFVVGSYVSIANIDGHTLIFLILSGLSTGLSWLCYFKALQLGDVNKVTPIDKSSTVLTIILAFIILGENITLSKVIGIIFIAIGTFMMITKKEGGTKQSNRAWLCYYRALQEGEASIVVPIDKLSIIGGYEYEILANGNSGLAKAGSGDMLSGLILGLAVKPYLDLFDAAIMASKILGEASNLALEDQNEYTMIASDIIKKIPQAMKFLGEDIE